MRSTPMRRTVSSGGIAWCAAIGSPFRCGCGGPDRGRKRFIGATKASQEVAFPQYDPVMPQDIVSRRQVEIEIRQRESCQILQSSQSDHFSGHLHLTFSFTGAEEGLGVVLGAELQRLLDA